MMPKRYRDPKRQAGFTLLEILIAITIFAIGVLALATMQISTIRGTEQAAGVTEAAVFASRTMEILAALPWNHPDLQDGDGDGTGQDADFDGVDDDGGNFGLDDLTDATDDAPTAPTAAGLVRSPVTAAGQTYNIFWNVAPGLPIGNTKTVKVTVTYLDRGTTKRVTLQRVVPRIV
jgi:type IV pilus assembly protein PilV